VRTPQDPPPLSELMDRIRSEVVLELPLPVVVDTTVGRTLDAGLILEEAPGAEGPGTVDGSG